MLLFYQHETNHDIINTIWFLIFECEKNISIKQKKSIILIFFIQKKIFKILNKLINCQKKNFLNLIINHENRLKHNVKNKIFSP